MGERRLANSHETTYCRRGIASRLIYARKMTTAHSTAATPASMIHAFRGYLLVEKELVALLALYYRRFLAKNLLHSDAFTYAASLK